MKKPKNEFECLYPHINCYSILEDELIHCNECPCPKNKNDTGIHKRIVFHYLKKKQYEEAYFYFSELISKLVGEIQCDIDGSLDFEQKDTSKMSPSCLLFKKNFELFQILDEIAELGKSDSETVTQQYNSAVRRFKDGIMANLERLTRIILDVQFKKSDKLVNHENLVEYYEKSIAAAKAKALHVKPADVLEQGFTDAAVGAGVLTEKHAEINKVRAEKAKNVMEKDKILEELQKYLISGQDIPEELKERLKKLGD